MGSNRKNRPRRARWVVIVSGWTFLLAVIMSFASHFFMDMIQSFYLSLVILLAVMLTGILFDLVGTAVAAARVAPLNSKAARRVPGARHGVYLVQNAEQVATFCNDVGGDISGIISGTLVAIVALRLAALFSHNQADFYLGVFFTALIAAFTVGGKAWGKIVAINHSTEVILVAGLWLQRFSRPLAWLRGGNE